MFGNWTNEAFLYMEGGTWRRSSNFVRLPPSKLIKCIGCVARKQHQPSYFMPSNIGAGRQIQLFSPLGQYSIRTSKLVVKQKNEKNNEKRTEIVTKKREKKLS